MNPTNNTGTKSPWMTHPLPHQQALRDNRAADVCVVGAGIAGLTTAYLLARSGLSVIVLESSQIAAGETGRSTAHITHALDDRYCELERLHGAEGARLAAESHTRAIDTIERLAREHEIACDFERLDGFLFLSPDRSSDLLKKEHAAALRAGLNSVELINNAPLGCKTGPCLRFPRQALFHPLKYLDGLANAFVLSGGQIFTHSHVTDIESGSTVTVKTADGYRVDAHSVVLATNTPINDRYIMHTKQAPYRTYAIALEIPAGSMTRALYWDTADPYHYVRSGGDYGPGKELLIVGGEDHKTGQADDGLERFTNLERWARDCFPHAETIAYQWSGQVLEPVDGLAYIGRNPRDSDNVYIVTSDSGNGITHGTVAGLLIDDLINGRANAWEKLYTPKRKALRALATFAHENLNVAAQYTDWVTPTHCNSLDQIPTNAGRIMRDGIDKIAVFRASDGSITRCSAVCPHLGGIVAWNDLEKSWDCPCHGSRFHGTGEVISGPSKAGLKKLSLPVNPTLAEM